MKRVFSLLSMAILVMLLSSCKQGSSSDSGNDDAGSPVIAQATGAKEQGGVDQDKKDIGNTEQKADTQNTNPVQVPVIRHNMADELNKNLGLPGDAAADGQDPTDPSMRPVPQNQADPNAPKKSYKCQSKNADESISSSTTIGGMSDDLKQQFSDEVLRKKFCFMPKAELNIDCYETPSMGSDERLEGGYARKTHVTCPDTFPNLPKYYSYKCEFHSSEKPNGYSSSSGAVPDLKVAFDDETLIEKNCTKSRNKFLGNSFDFDCFELDTEGEPLKGGYVRKGHIDCPEPKALDTNSMGSGTEGPTMCEVDFHNTREELGISLNRSKMVNLQVIPFDRKTIQDKIEPHFCPPALDIKSKFIVTCKRFTEYGANGKVAEKLHFLVECP